MPSATPARRPGKRARREAARARKLAGLDPQPSAAPLAPYALVLPDEEPRPAAPARTTTRDGGDETPIDAQGLAEHSGGLIPVYVLRTGETSRTFERKMPPLTQVYGGAGRLYDVDQRWVQDPYASPLHLARNDQEAERATRALREEITTCLATCPGLQTASRLPRREPPRPWSGTVKTLVPPSRALVASQDERGRAHGPGGTALSGMAQVDLEDSAPGLGIEIGQLLAEGQQIEGTYDPVTGLVDLSARLRAPERALEGLQEGAVILVRVASMREGALVVEPYPGLTVTIPKARVTPNPADRLEDLFSIGSVARARVEAVDVPRPGPASLHVTTPRLSMADVDDDEPVLPAPSLLAGGPPWLTEPDVTAWEAADLGEGEDSRARRISELERALALVRARLDDVRARYREARRRTEAAEVALDEERRLRAQVQAGQARATRRPVPGPRGNGSERGGAERRAVPSSPESARTPEWEDEDLFLDPDDQVRYEVYLAWARYTRPEDKEEWALPASYVIGPRFAQSLAELEGVERGKVMRVVVDVLTGRVREIPGRRLHRLRTGPGGSPPLVREDGAAAWRVSLQERTPSARRLHFWRLADGRIELANVAIHDDVDI